MFIPFGILYPLSKNKHSIKKTVKLGVICTLSIELLQPIFGRAFDINDLILNTIGVLVGTSIFYIVRKLLMKKR